MQIPCMANTSNNYSHNLFLRADLFLCTVKVLKAIYTWQHLNWFRIQIDLHQMCKCIPAVMCYAYLLSFCMSFQIGFSMVSVITLFARRNTLVKTLASTMIAEM